MLETPLFSPCNTIPWGPVGEEVGGKEKERERKDLSKFVSSSSRLRRPCLSGSGSRKGGIREREFVIVPTRKEGVNFFLFLGTPINHRSEEEEEEEATSNLFAAGDQDEIGGGKEKSTIPARKRFLFCGGL